MINPLLPRQYQFTYSGNEYVFLEKLVEKILPCKEFEASSNEVIPLRIFKP